MDRITRYEFLGSPVLFAILTLTGVGIPFALLYLLNKTIAIEHQVEDAEAFVKQFRSGRIG